MSDKFDRMILQVMPWLPQVLKKVVRRIERFDGREPVTLLAEIERDVSAVTEKVRGREGVLFKGLRVMLAHMSFEDELARTMQTCIHLVEQQVRADPRSAQLLRLIEEADKRVPLVSCVALLNHVDLRQQLRPLSLPAVLLEEAASKRGEAKATLLIDALGKTAELLYDPYLRVLWKLTCYARGKWPKDLKKFGCLVNELSQRLADYPGLVDGDAGWMRNSARHERWYPIPGDDAVVMWDDRVPQRKVSLRELEEKVNAMYRMAGATFGSVARLYFFRNILTGTGMWQAFGAALPVAFATDEWDESKTVEIERAIEAKLEVVKQSFEPLSAFMVANGQAEASPSSQQSDQ